MLVNEQKLPDELALGNLAPVMCRRPSCRRTNQWILAVVEQPADAGRGMALPALVRVALNLAGSRRARLAWLHKPMQKNSSAATGPLGYVPL